MLAGRMLPPVICSLGREILEHLGYRVEVAREGLEALRLYGGNGGADLVILDFYLPGPNDSQVLKELKVMDPGARVLPFLFSFNPSLNAAGKYPDQHSISIAL